MMATANGTAAHLRALVALLVAALSVSLTGCGGGGDDPEDAECIEFVGPLQPGQTLSPPYCPR